MRFALIGAAGYVAPRHMQAIEDTGNLLVAAVDPHDSVGILDKYGRDIQFFTDADRFDRYLERQQREGQGVDWVSIASPNHLHDAHIRMAARAGCNVLCEKPLVINPWNLDALEELEAETGVEIRTILQLRLHPEVIKLRDKVIESIDRHEVTLNYHTPRGPWYYRSWKGDTEKSGGIMTNIGIHLFDMLLWVFGECTGVTSQYEGRHFARGELEFEFASVTWELSTEAATATRSVEVDGEKVDFTKGFDQLHTETYANTVAGKGFTIADARPAVELVSRLRHG